MDDQDAVNAAVTTDDPERILAVGDLHADTGVMVQVVQLAVELKADVIVQVGDMGFWPRDEKGRKFLRKTEAHCARTGIPWWWVDGNHEDHDRLDLRPLAADGTRPISEHVIHLPRGHRWTWGGFEWLALGGAPSVDKYSSTAGVDWFEQEEATREQCEAAAAGGHADVVVAHDSPYIVGGKLYRHYKQDVPPWHREGQQWPTSALIRSDDHQRRMRHVLDEVTPSLWLNGHHHMRFTDHVGGCTVEALGMNRDGLRNLCLLVDAAGNRLYS